MNFRQRRMLIAIGIAMVTLLLWPPVRPQSSAAEAGLTYVWLFSEFDGSIQIALLFAECLALALLGLVVYRMLEDRQDE